MEHSRKMVKLQIAHTKKANVKQFFVDQKKFLLDLIIDVR